MTDSGVCPIHPDRAATFTCPRCGDFGCDECANRAVPSAQPICPSCWSRRAERVAKMTRDDGSYVAIGALALGVLGLVPFFLAAQIAAIVLGAVALRRVQDNPKRRTMATIGLFLGCLGLLGSCFAFMLLSAGAFD